MSNLLLIVMFLIFNPTTQSCLPPNDLKATVVNNYEDLQLTWKKPTTGPEVVSFDIHINNRFINRTKETTYLIQNAQYQVYEILIDSNCANGHPSRFSVNIGFVGNAIYSTIRQSSVDIDWSTTATLNDLVDIKNIDQNINIFLLRRSNTPTFYNVSIKDRITYTGDLTAKKISFTLSDVTTVDAGYYMSAVGKTDRGGRVLVVLDRPLKPTLPNRHSYVGKTLELTCNSQKTSKPDYYIPKLNYTWFINGSVHVYNPSHQDRYSQSQNRLIIDNITRKDKGHRFSCKASDRGQQSEQSETITLDPLYGPEIVILTPDTKDNVLKVGEKFGPINCSAECNPYCIFTWKFRKPGDAGPRREITRSNILTIDKVTREDAGEYRCAFRSSDSNTLPQNNTKTIDLNVQFQPEIKNITYSVKGGAILVINTGRELTVSENDDINLQCNIEANPKASISWKRNGQVLKQNSSGETLIYNLGQTISCETSGVYSCEADNGILSAVQRNVSLHVQCKPKQNMLTSIDNLYGSRLNSTENVSVSIFAYPRPLHRWTTNTTGILKERQVVIINSYSYRYEGLVRIQRSTDFGNYCLDLTNNKGSSVICIKIQSEDIPEAPSSFTVEDTSTESISLNWISEFRGGDEQRFYLEYREKERYSSFMKINMSDDGRGKLIRVSVKNLKIDVVYVFRLYSSNRFGKSKSQEIQVKTEACRIIEPVSVSPSLIGFYAGVTMVVLVVVIDIAVIVAVVIVLKRRKRPLGNNGDYWYSEIKESDNNDTFVAEMNKSSERSKTGCAIEINEDGYLTAIDIEDNEQTVERQSRNLNRSCKRNKPKESDHDYINV